MTDEITPARLRKLAEANRDAFDGDDVPKKNVALAKSAAALRAAATAWESEIERADVNAGAANEAEAKVESRDAVIAEQDATLAAREALLKKAGEGLVDCGAALVAATSLLERGGKKAAASDKMFAIMLADYNAAIERFRALSNRIDAVISGEKGGD